MNPRRFTVRGHPEYGFRTGVLGDGRQVLIATAADGSVRRAIFAADGVLEALTFDDAPAVVDGPISVQPFAWPDEGLSLYELPEHYQAFLDDPDAFDDDERERYPALIRTWREDGDFVLAWCDEYWLDADGNVTST